MCVCEANSNAFLHKHTVGQSRDDIDGSLVSEQNIRERAITAGREGGVQVAEEHASGREEVSVCHCASWQGGREGRVGRRYGTLCCAHHDMFDARQQKEREAWRARQGWRCVKGAVCVCVCVCV